jgi:hypothetical protein
MDLHDTRFLLAWFIANVGVHNDQLEMTPTTNLSGPPICEIVCLLLFAIFDHFFNKPD